MSKKKWELWFAWRPVRLIDTGRLVWLSVVERSSWRPRRYRRNLWGM